MARQNAEASSSSLSRLKAASEAVDAAQAALEAAKAETKECREQWEEAVNNLRKEARDAVEPTLFDGDAGKGADEIAGKVGT